MMNVTCRRAYWVAVTLCAILVACKGDSGMESNSPSSTVSVQFTGQCSISPLTHSFNTTTAGEVTASFKQLQPPSGTNAAINLRDGVSGNITNGNPGMEVKATLPAGSHSLTVSHNHIEPLCSYTVEVVYSR